MGAYYSDGRGRYGTGESYDWFPKYGEEVEVSLSSDGLWSYDEAEGGIVLPDTLEDMSYAFECCYSLKNIDVPGHVKNFSWAFEGVPLEHFAFPQGTENISRAFLGCSHLRRVFIPKTVTDCYEAFPDCEALTEVTLEEGITRISEWAFFHCTSLREITIPESVTEFGRWSVGFMEVREYDEKGTGYRIRGRQVVPGFKIRGVPGSAAEKYAGENGIEFIAVRRSR